MASAPDLLEVNRQRIRAWHRTGDLRALWPDIPAQLIAAAHGCIRTVTQDVLREAPVPPGLDVEHELDARALGAAAFMSGMGPLLGWWIERGLVHASPRAREVLFPHLEHTEARRSKLWAALTPALDALERRGVVPILLKGLHTGAVYFPHAGTRPLGDIDLLVRPTHRAAAAAALTETGFAQSRSTTFAERSEWVSVQDAAQVHSLELDHRDNPWSLDLHTGLERWYFRGGRAGFGMRAFENAVPLSLAGRTVHVLGQPHLTAFLALHTSYEVVRTRLVRLLELVWVIRRDLASGALTWDGLSALLDQTGTERFTYPALDLAERLSPGTVDPGVLRRLRRLASPRTLRVLAAVDANHLSALWYRSLDDKVMWARGAREWILNLSELIWPSADAGGLPEVGRLHLRRLQLLRRARARVRASPP